MRLPISVVRSGGQTGVDQVGLEVAWLERYPTGGVAPKGWRTDAGPMPELLQFYGLTESHSPLYVPRTIKNAQASDRTVWFGDPLSPGGRLTIRNARRVLLNPSAGELRAVVETTAQACSRAITLNVAGNRLRTNPFATDYAFVTLTAALR